MTKHTLPTHDAMVSNILRIMGRATVEQREAGARWYRDAHDIAETLAIRHHITVDQSAGIIAALSPLNPWGTNITLANRLMLNRGLRSGYLKIGLNKANSILRHPELDAGDIADVLHGLKTMAFYEAIRTAGQTDTVCIDRHAYAVAVGGRSETPRITPKQYAAISAAYAAVAHDVMNDMYSPVEVQAITWLAWRARYYSEGAFDTYTID